MGMSDNDIVKKTPISTVRFGIGKEIQLYPDELVIMGKEEGKEGRVPLDAIKRLILTPGDPNPSKLILMADLYDDEDEDMTVILVEGMTNARDFRAMIPRILELRPDIELDPPDMEEQLRQALNNRRAWSLTCYGSIILFLIMLYLLYLAVAFLGAHH
jgi:hypothetical protein